MEEKNYEQRVGDKNVRKDRKYKKYVVFTVSPKGNEIRIEYPEDDEIDYFKMVNHFNEIKQEYTYNKKTVLKGITEDNDYEIIYENINNEFNIDADTTQLLGQMFMIIEELKRRNKSMSKKMSEFDLAKDELEHDIEGYENVSLDNEEKIKLFDKLREIRLERRKFKTDSKLVTLFNNQIDVSEFLFKIGNIINVARERNGELDTGQKVKKSDLKEIDPNCKIIEYDKKKCKEKKRMIKQLKYKYKIIDDVENSRLLLYKK